MRQMKREIKDRNRDMNDMLDMDMEMQMEEMQEENIRMRRRRQLQREWMWQEEERMERTAQEIKKKGMSTSKEVHEWTRQVKMYEEELNWESRWKEMRKFGMMMEWGYEWRELDKKTD